MLDCYEELDAVEMEVVRASPQHVKRLRGEFGEQSKNIKLGLVDQFLLAMEDVFYSLRDGRDYLPPQHVRDVIVDCVNQEFFLLGGILQLDIASSVAILGRAAHGPHFDLHHILPLSLGGSNDLSNLALVYRPFHKAIHRYVEQQGELKVGEAREIRIPCSESACRVWGMFSACVVEKGGGAARKLPSTRGFVHENKLPKIGGLSLPPGRVLQGGGLHLAAA